MNYGRGVDRGEPGTGPGEETRKALLAASRRLFGLRGFDGTSIRAITRMAGANLGAVTYHFGSKRALYGAVLEDGLRPLAERVAAAAQSDGTGRERMLRVVEAYFAHLESRPDLPRLLLQEVAAGKTPPEVVVEIIQGVAGTIARLQREGVADGSVRSGHPYLAALSVVSQPVFFTLVGPLLHVVAGIDLGDPDTRRGVLEHVQAFVHAGLAPRQETSS
jgi:AcrR family transcriptional regulator